jgi:hypothetical protein
MKIMKTFKRSLILLAAIISFAAVIETKAQSVSVSVNFNTFQQELSPHGRWMNNPRFGQVWVYGDPDFKPYYTNGHWQYTNYGWSWISDYTWGWAPFHYGRWEYDNYYGWMWIPGYEWASAWVSWSSYDDYYGWAPLGYGININVSFGSIPYNRWNFIPRRNICDRNVYRYIVPYERNSRFRNAVVINNYYYGGNGVGRYMRGPERIEAERYTNRRIEERNVNYSDRNWSRGNSVRNNNDGYGRRENDAVNRNNSDNNSNGVNRRRNDVNDDPVTASSEPGRKPGKNIKRSPKWKDEQPAQKNNAENGNYPRRREINQDRDNTPAPVNENRRPTREVNPVPQTNDNNNPGKRQHENRMNRSNDQQSSAPQQQRYERPAPQQQQYERHAPQQQSAPQMEQRKMERRSDNGAEGMQRSNNKQRGGSRNG